MKVSYANLKLKVDNSVKTFKYNDTEIEILNYLPIEDKYNLIMITLQESKVNDIYNPVLLDMHFHLNLIYMYTNISFTDKQREDEMKIFDNLKSNGLINSFLMAFDKDEYDELLNFMDEIIKDEMKYKVSAAAILSTIVNDLPKSAQAANDIVNNFDKEKFAEVINFAQAANGNRPI